MAKNGPLFLARTKHEFLEDLTDSFGDRADAFTEDLRVLLFELWVRARSRAPFPEHRPEPTDEMQQAEHEHRLVASLDGFDFNNTKLQHAFARAVQSCITVGQGITRSDNSATLDLQLEADTNKLLDQEQFAKMLDHVLQVRDSSFEKWLDRGTHTVELELKFEAGGPAHELGLELEKLGVCAPPHNWVPLFQHLETGQVTGLDPRTNQEVHQHEVNTLLVYDGSVLNWLFPNPKPTQCYNGNGHIKIFVDDAEETTATATWTDSFDGDRSCQVVDSVGLPTATASSQVRAIYSVSTKEYGV